MTNKFKINFKEIPYKTYLIWIVMAFILNFAIEGINRGSLNEAIVFFNDNTRRFMVNYLIVLAFTSPCILVNKIYFIFTVISEILVVLAISSFIVYKFRGSPLTFSDFYSISDGIAIAGQYLSMPLIIAIAVILGLIILVAFLTFRINKKEKLKINIYSIVIVPLVVLLAQQVMIVGTNKEILIPNQWDIKLSYDDNGFIYSLYNSYKAYKREEPKNYNQAQINTIKDGFMEEALEVFAGKGTEANNQNPNVIVLQIESVMDPLTIENSEYTDDPMKNIRKNMEKYSSGKLQVPTIGGGTARTEFEVMTGVSMDYFSPGEIPHTTILKKQPVESMAYVLDSKNYEKTLIHNFEGSFYGRDKIYGNLGFDRFIPVEYMQDVDYSGGYPKDTSILENVKSTLESSDKRDMIFAIAVQTHGGYVSEYDNTNSEVKVSGDLEECDLNQIQDFVDDLVEVDKMVGDMVEYVESLDEPTILAVYSDHLPALDVVTNSFSNEDKYLAPYFVCDNMGLEKQDEDIEAYQLSTKVFDGISVEGGVMNKFHRSYKYNEDYQTKLELLQYDTLYGKKYIIDGKKIFNKTKMTLGLKEIKIESAYTYGENILVVTGEGFTPSSRIAINGEQYETTYLDSNTIQTQLESNIDNTQPIKITVNQVSRYDKPIGITKPYEFTLE